MYIIHCVIVTPYRQIYRSKRILDERCIIAFCLFWSDWFQERGWGPSWRWASCLSCTASPFYNDLVLAYSCVLCCFISIAGGGGGGNFVYVQKNSMQRREPSWGWPSNTTWNQQPPSQDRSPFFPDYINIIIHHERILFSRLSRISLCLKALI